MTAWATTSASLWPARPALAVERHAAEHQPAGRVVAEGVDVEALAHPHGQRHRSSARLEVDRAW